MEKKESIEEGLYNLNLIKRKLLPDKKIPDESLISYKSVILAKDEKKFQTLRMQLNHVNPILFCNNLTS